MRQELVKQLDLQITQMEAVEKGQGLGPQHPLAQLAHDLKILRPILEKVRIEIVNSVYTSASGQEGLIAEGDILSRSAAYNPQVRVLELAKANNSDDLTQEKGYENLAGYLLPIVVHELDHAAMLTEGYVDNWSEHQHTYVLADGSSCKTTWWNSPSAKFREEPTIKVFLDFGLDFFSGDQPKTFHFDGVAWHYSAYPTYLGENSVCVPAKYQESLKATETHAFQTQARLLLGMHYQLFGLTPQDLSILLSNEKTMSDQRTKLKNNVVQKLESEGWKQWNYKDILLHYLAAGEDMVSHQKGQDIEDFYTSRYNKPTPNPEGCFEPQLPE